MASSIRYILLGDSHLLGKFPLSQAPIWRHFLHVSRRTYFGKSKPATKDLQQEIFPPRLFLPENHGYTPTLSPQQVSSLLMANETTKEAKTQGINIIRGFDSNTLASNTPIEDRRAHASLLQTEGMLFGVFDGHAGCACAQALSERLFDYIAVSLLPVDKLEAYSHALKTDSSMEILHRHKNLFDYKTDDMALMYRNNLQRFIVETLSTIDLELDPDYVVHNALETAFKRLDSDISVEALPQSGMVNMDALEVALSGACATVAHIQNLDVHVASVGDTRAVIGQLTDAGEWVALPLSHDHNTHDEAEVERVKSEHPLSESDFVIKHDRLLGQLIPLRAFGDVRYKWSAQELKNLIKILDTSYAQTILPMNYHTPPYLSCTPDVTHHRLTTHDKFIVLASDGLWEVLSNEEVVRIVGEHMLGEDTVDNYKPASESMRLGQINKVLSKRKATLAMKCGDDNVATHLIRHTLGPDHRKISDMLTMPPEVVRYYRDDITITVVFFDSAYIKKHSPTN